MIVASYFCRYFPTSLKLDEGTSYETVMVIGGYVGFSNEDGHHSTKLSEVFDGVRWRPGNLTMPLGLFKPCIRQISEVKMNKTIKPIYRLINRSFLLVFYICVIHVQKGLGAMVVGIFFNSLEPNLLL